MPTETPPPYFPQGSLSPPDEKTRRKMRLTLYGCLLLMLVAVVGGVWGIVYLIRQM